MKLRSFVVGTTLLVVCGACSPSPSQNEEDPKGVTLLTLEGRIIGMDPQSSDEDGEPIEIRLDRYGEFAPAVSVQAGADGFYSITAPDESIYRGFVSQGDTRLSLPVLPFEAGTVNVDIDLTGQTVTSSDPAIQKGFELGIQLSKAHEDGRRAFKESGRNEDLAEALTDMRNVLATTFDDPATPEALRAFAGIRWLSTPGIDDEEVERVHAGLAPESVYWAYGFRHIFQIDAERWGDLLLELWQENPIEVVRGIALARLTRQAMDDGNDELWQARFDELSSQYGHITDVEYHLTSLSPERKVQVGLPLPDFQLTSLDTGDGLSKERFEGSYLLLDFWATWCLPCTAELPRLQEAWDRYKDQDFHLVSVSLDSDVAKVHSFREEDTPMPWLQAWAGPETFDSEVAKDLEIKELPTMILVDPEGIIIAAGDELYGEPMDATLEQHLGPGN